jgi:hypothetical protein
MSDELTAQAVLYLAEQQRVANLIAAYALGSLDSGIRLDFTALEIQIVAAISPAQSQPERITNV